MSSFALIAGVISMSSHHDFLMGSLAPWLISVSHHKLLHHSSPAVTLDCLESAERDCFNLKVLRELVCGAAAALSQDPYGHSYWSIMLKPILEAANEVLPAGKQFWFAVEGEMGGTIMTYPAQYLKVFKAIKDEWRSPAKLHVGFTVNHAYIMGHVTRYGSAAYSTGVDNACCGVNYLLLGKQHVSTAGLSSSMSLQLFQAFAATGHGGCCACI